MLASGINLKFSKHLKFNLVVIRSDSFISYSTLPPSHHLYYLLLSIPTIMKVLSINLMSICVLLRASSAAPIEQYVKIIKHWVVSSIHLHICCVTVH